MDMSHHIHLLVNKGKLILSPVDPAHPIHHVLDVGCGTGIWAIDYADEHPEAKVESLSLISISR